jgi:uncharacterized RDD family membrane protein YckC
VIDVGMWIVVLTPATLLLYRHRPASSVFTALWLGAMLLLFAYLTVLDGGPRWATAGKRIVRIRVVDAESGEPIGYRRGAMRTAALLAGGIAFYVGWLIALSDPRRQAWHDRVARTLVVKTR